MLNVKQLIVDTDEATIIADVANPVVTNIEFVRGNTYILQANCYTNAYSSSIATFDSGDTWRIDIGRQYDSNASPVVSITASGNFNQASDWSLVNVSAGAICALVNVNGTALTTDIANNESQAYTFEWVATNNVGAQVVVIDSNCTIYNAAQTT